MTKARIRIDKLAFGGSGVGRIDGKVCFVPLSCPGDELNVRIISEKRSYLNAQIIDVITPSSHRVEPPCPLFGSCGGCSWQHIAYTHQVEAKQQILAETLWRGARVSAELVADVVPSPLQFGYRSRVQFKVYGGADRFQIGFYRHGSHFVEDAPKGCPIALPVINQAVTNLRNLLVSFPDPTAIPQINIDCGEKGAVAIVNYIGQDLEGASAFFENRFKAMDPLTGLFIQSGRKSSLRKVYGSDLLEYSMPAKGIDASPCSLKFLPGGFSQINSPQNRTMLELVRNLACFQGHEKLFDLYCGNGNFSIPIAREVSSVTGIEECEGSIAAAVDNCLRNGIDNAEFITSDAAGGTRRLADEGRNYQVVILDPPRSGAAESVLEICRFNPEKIIYISCDPSTLARDCGLLSTKGYHVRTCVPVDMFPQTYHLESITLLEQE